MLIEEVTGILGDPARAGVVLDIDGTLAPIVPRPELARVPAATRAAIGDLVGRYALVAVVSGRTPAEASALVDVAGVVVVGQYGLEAPALPERVVAAVEAAVRDTDGAWIEGKGVSVAVHLRGTPDPDAAEADVTPKLESLAAAAGLELLRGKRVVELVPAGMPRKGAAVERLIAGTALEAALYAGDDDADLEAFAALDRLAAEGLRAVRVAVRGEETPADVLQAADVVVDGPERLAELLGTL